MRLIVAVLLLLCSVHARAQAAPTLQLERGNGPEPSTLDAHRCQEVACGNVVRDLYEGLVTEDAAGRLIPGMAERWEASADGRTWTFHLRPGLRWSNGEALDAQQVVASFQRAFSPKTAAPFAELFDALHNARAVQAGKVPAEKLGVRALDERRIVFTLDRSAALPALMTLPLAFPVYLPAVKAYGAQHTLPGKLVSNGAYRLRAWTPQASLSVEQNPHFHDAGTVSIPRVRYQVTEDAAAELQRYAAGDLHITETVPPQPRDALRERFGEQLRIAPYLGSFWLGMNLTRPPFKDSPALREALSLAIDRDRLTRHVTGLGEAPAYGIVPAGIAGYTGASIAWSEATQAEREARARALYRAAGYSKDRPLVLELRYNTSTPHRRMALAVASMWRDVLGVQVRLRNEEWKVFVQNRRQRAITQVFRGGWVGDVVDARNFLAAFGSDGPLNWTGFDDAGFRQRLARADAAKTEAARNAWLRTAEQAVLNQHAVIPLYFYSSKHLVRPEVLGFEPNPLDRHASRWLRWQD
ncbi:MAG: peptide ABC transporter substrate-binding protein [Pseudoxanthomonas sp.]|nr:peptide ABC transporter substrate-binding protein [Pseudoxanthomonas sp.]